MNQNEQYKTQLKVNTGQQKSTRKKVGTQTDTATQTSHTVKKPVGKMVLFGAMSASLYVFLFANESMVTQTFTLGGWHAAFPVVTAFLFSFIHGAFASNLLSVIGLEAKKAAH